MQCTVERLELEAVAATIRIENDSAEIAKLRNAYNAVVGPLTDERNALQADAAGYRWLVENHKSWSWNPSQYGAETTSGFAAFGTGYLGCGFTDAVDAAMAGCNDRP